MIFSIVIGLVIALIVVAVIANAMQQHKAKQDAQKRQEIAKYKAIIEETEELLMNAGSLPISQHLILVMHQRVLEALKSISQLAPESNDIKSRLKDAQVRVDNFDPTAKTGDDNIQVPDDDKAIIALIKGIKKLRTLLRSEHSKGKVDTGVFMKEDKRLESMQLKINIDSLMKRGKAAQKSGMVGSARQYFEKAFNTLSAKINPDEYVNSRKQELEGILKQIESELKDANAKGREKEPDEFDDLFHKKKW
ncbi:hypothetical protein HR060_12230 [Catenovulum sp. SM1970]|uniref:hypothetical protein n=1 Tax=Marinifaba aquimaris TaxID=2741323 RepID=UPI0015730727|nr:hypothetical protein [Marinifaba aquimaris]NTS77628.1 hypothetical protein [Marinifaba aquimaris]